jgi:hypothetical protein
LGSANLSDPSNNKIRPKSCGLERDAHGRNVGQGQAIGKRPIPSAGLYLAARESKSFGRGFRNPVAFVPMRLLPHPVDSLNAVFETLFVPAQPDFSNNPKP